MVLPRFVLKFNTYQVHILGNELTSLKTKLRGTCEKYSKIKVPYKCKKVSDNLSKSNSMVILKQVKGRVV